MTVHEIGKDARSIWLAGVASVNAKDRVQRFVRLDKRFLFFGDYAIDHDDYQNILVVGAGKSAGEMAAALDDSLVPLADRKLIRGIVNVPDGRELQLQRIRVVGCRPVGVNLPTHRVLESTSEMIDLLIRSGPDDLVIGLFSGGGSALLERPIASVSLADLQAVTALLSQKGASIEELNLVRGQLSQVKAGGLARMSPCRNIVSMLISDVLGDPIAAIASGPTNLESSVSRATLRTKARDIISRYDPQRTKVPLSVLQVLDSDSDASEAKSNHCHDVRHFVIANNQLAVLSAFEEAMKLGYSGSRETEFEATRVQNVAQRMVRQLKLWTSELNFRPGRLCLISGGEPTVVVGNSPGRGGRNQHLALAFLDAIISERLADPTAFANVRFSFLSAGTDGEDGNVPVAGAVIDSDLIDRLDLSNVSSLVRQHLEHADSNPLLESLGCIFQVGETKTNVCDLRVLLCTKDVHA